MNSYKLSHNSAVHIDGVLKATTVLPSSTVSVNNISGRELLIGKNDNGQYSVVFQKCCFR